MLKVGKSKLEDYEMRAIVCSIWENKLLYRKLSKKYLHTYKIKRQANVPIEEITERTLLILMHEKLIKYVVERYFKYSGSFEDLVSMGKFGLIKAIDSFDEDKNVEFSTYAIGGIRQAITNEIRTRQSKSAIPESLMSYLTDAINVNSSSDDELTLEDVLAEEGDFTEMVADVCECEQIYRYFVYLNPEEQMVVAYYLGLFGVERLRMEQIAKLINKTRTNCVNKFNKAIRKLKIIIKGQKKLTDVNEACEHYKLMHQKYPLIAEVEDYFRLQQGFRC